MKKALTAIMLAFLLVFAFVGCAEEPAGPPSDSDQPSVTPPDDSDEEEILQLSADYIVLGVGLTKQLTLTYDGEEIAASEAVWTASGSAATAEGGLVTGVSEGECTVTAEYGGETAEASVIVTVIQRLTVSESEVVIALDGTAKLEASVGELRDDAIAATDEAVTYSSGDPSVVTVDGEGNLYGVQSGATRILVQSGDLSVSVAVTVCEEIKTAAEFREKLTADPDGTFLITQDIDFSGMQYFALTSFSGTLYGGGHKLTNLLLVNHLSSAATNYGGALFENLTGTVCDLYIGARYEAVVRETDQLLHEGIAQFGGVIANLLYGTVENVYINVDYQIYPWYSQGWNECGAVCGRLRGNAEIRGCIIEYSCATPESTLGSGLADIHTIYGMTDSNTQTPVIDNVYILNSGSYKKDYRNTASDYFGSIQPMFNGIYEFEETQALAEAVQGTAMQTVYEYAQA